MAYSAMTSGDSTESTTLHFTHGCGEGRHGSPVHSERFIVALMSSIAKTAVINTQSTCQLHILHDIVHTSGWSYYKKHLSVLLHLADFFDNTLKLIWSMIKILGRLYSQNFIERKILEDTLWITQVFSISVTPSFPTFAIALQIVNLNLSLIIDRS